MAKYTTDADADLLSELGVDTAPSQTAQRTPREERIIAGFEDIERFVADQGHLPQHGEDRDIFERIYAVRLDRLRESEECRAILTPLDSQGLLTPAFNAHLATEVDELDDEALLAFLGVDATPSDDITQLTYVRSRQEIKAAEEIAQRTPAQTSNSSGPSSNRYSRT